MAAGIEERHARSCRQRHGGRCSCDPSYRASVWTGERRIKKTFRNFSEAQGWRKDARIALRRNRPVQVQAPGTTLKVAAEEWLKAAEGGLIRTRSGDIYKPSAVRSYERSLRLRVFPEYGDEPLEDIRRADLQALVDRLIADGLSASTIQTTIIPLKAVFRHELRRDRLTVNPTTGLDLPAIRGGRERIASPAEAVELLAAVPDDDRALWATAMYAGLRRGELMALRVDHLDFDAGVIRVQFGWDDKEGRIETKGRRRRNVPIAVTLSTYLKAHLLRTGRRDSDLVFGRTATVPFAPGRLTERADSAWKGRQRITLHEARHTSASFWIAAGVNAKAISQFMGHSSITVTFDKYGHLMKGGEEEAAALLDAYLTAGSG